MRSFCGLFLALVLFVPSAFAQETPQYGGSWTFSFDVDLYDEVGNYRQKLNPSLTVQMPNTTMSGAWHTSYLQPIPGAGGGSYVEFRSRPDAPGTLEVLICYYGPGALYIGKFVYRGVTPAKVNNRSTVFKGDVIIFVIPNNTGFHAWGGSGKAELRPN